MIQSSPEIRNWAFTERCSSQYSHKHVKSGQLEKNEQKGNICSEKDLRTGNCHQHWKVEKMEEQNLPIEETTVTLYDRKRLCTVIRTHQQNER